jgi:seryl-tRNA synthetase
MSILKLIRNPTMINIVKISHKNRYTNKNTLIEEIIISDNKWKKARRELDQLNKFFNNISKKIHCRKIQDIKFIKKIKFIKEEQDLNEYTFEQLILLSKYIKKILKLKEKQINLNFENRSKLINMVGNILHKKCPISNTEKDNEILKIYGKQIKKKFNHVELMKKINGYNLKKGSIISGTRGYYLLKDIVKLNQALINYGLDFLEKYGYISVQTPYFMLKNMMKKVAQLKQFHKELYEIENDKYLIATSEQPLYGLHYNEIININNLPIKYAGYSTCFRKEVGSHGKDTLGIFRVHQFEKVEQFCITDENSSWKMMDLMLEISEKFYQSLDISYRVVNIVSGKLNNAAALKYDIEAWFPGSFSYRELVSCSNCTNYQSHKMNIKYNSKNEKKYVHMLNATLCATQRTMCCLIETHQTDEGILIPKVLQSYMGEKKMIKFSLKC